MSLALKECLKRKIGYVVTEIKTVPRSPQFKDWICKAEIMSQGLPRHLQLKKR
jgi:hypothetical protein